MKGDPHFEPGDGARETLPEERGRWGGKWKSRELRLLLSRVHLSAYFY